MANSKRGHGARGKKKMAVNDRESEKNRSVSTRTMQKVYREKNEDEAKKTLKRRIASRKRMQAKKKGTYAGAGGALTAIVDYDTKTTGLGADINRDIRMNKKKKKTPKESYAEHTYKHMPPNPL